MRICESLNVPCRVTVDALDFDEVELVAAIIRATPDEARKTIGTLRGGDFASANLEIVVRAIDRNLRAGRPHEIASAVQTAVDARLIREHHRVNFERMLHEICEASSSIDGTRHRYLVIVRGALRAMREIGDRAAQAGEQHRVTEGAIDALGRSILEADDLAEILDALAAQMTDTARRLRTEVAPRPRMEVAA